MNDDTGKRIEYGDVPLRRSDLPVEPFPLLREWMAAAAAAGVSEPNGMALATCDADGQPHVRIVLMKRILPHGFVFFTNKQSDKGLQLAVNPRAAATFWWQLPSNRQVRIVGAIEHAPDALADEYFASRPRRAQICSAASPQSHVVADRNELEGLVARLEARISTGPVVRPAHWGGYVLVPRSTEFWQGRDGRLHDRFRYTLRNDGWSIDRLAP